MAGEARPIAMGVGGIKFGTVVTAFPVQISKIIPFRPKEVLHLTLQIQRK